MESLGKCNGRGAERDAVSRARDAAVYIRVDTSADIKIIFSVDTAKP